MKKIASITCLVFALQATGCAGWWQSFKDNPAAQVSNIASVVQTVISIATVIFGQVKVQLPSEAQVKAQTAFDTAVVDVNHAMAALQSALDAAMAAKQDKPDLAGFIKAVTDAVTHLQGIVNSLKASVPGPGQQAFGAAKGGQQVDDLDQCVKLLKKKLADQ